MDKIVIIGIIILVCFVLSSGGILTYFLLNKNDTDSKITTNTQPSNPNITTDSTSSVNVSSSPGTSINIGSG